ncbi:MAG: ATP-binding protein, partial [Lachnospiraceae bacterium]
LDAGIYEYLLGELLDLFEKGGKGQLLFTSHNLRPLEMLQKDNILFSTSNKANRYIPMRSVGNTNNLRDVYLRSITLGGQKECIYKETDRLKIARALRKVGRELKDDR